MEPYSKYLFPSESEKIAYIVVWTQIIGFGIWCLILLIIAFISGRNWWRLRKCRDVNVLADFLRQNYGQRDNENNNLSSLINDDEAEAAFNGFCKDRKLPKRSPIYTHLKTIFFAGLKESQLDVTALIKNTGNRFSTNNATLRAALTLFIIAGLFGTLFGLADSLSQLSTIVAGNKELNNVVLSDALKTLLGKLGGAFAPSLWGVGFTIIGVVLFSAYLRIFSQRTNERLERQTVSDWIPRLMLNSSQQMLEKLRLSERQMMNNFEAANKVAEFAEQIKGDVSGLTSNIQNANSSLSQLDEAVGNVTEASRGLIKFSDDFTQTLNGFANKFQTSIDTLSPFGEKLSNLYTQVKEDSTYFQTKIDKTVEESRNFRDVTLEESASLRTQIKEYFDRQSRQSQKILELLELYRAAYLENSDAIDRKLQETLSSAKSALDNLNLQYDVLIGGLVEKFGNPIREQLQNDLTKMTSTLSEISSEITKNLNDVSAASGIKLDGVSNNINLSLRGVAQVIDANLRDISQNIHTNLKEVSQTMDTNLKEVSQTMDTNFKDVSQNIDTNLKDVSRNIDANLKNVSENIKEVEGDLRRLQDPVEKSARAIDSTATSFYTQTEKFLEQIKREFQTQNQENGNQNTNLADLNTGIQNLVIGLQSLGEEIKTYNQQKPYNQPKSYNHKEVNKTRNKDVRTTSTVPTENLAALINEPIQNEPVIFVPPVKPNIFRRAYNKIKEKIGR